MVGFKENSTILRTFVPNPSSAPGKEDFLSFIDMSQVIILCIFVLVIFMLVLVLIWCGFCYLYAIQWMSRSRELWDGQPKQTNTLVTFSTHV